MPFTHAKGSTNYSSALSISGLELNSNKFIYSVQNEVTQQQTTSLTVQTTTYNMHDFIWVQLSYLTVLQPISNAIVLYTFEK